MSIKDKFEYVIEETRLTLIVIMPYVFWVFVLLGLIGLLFACKKEEPKPQPIEPQCDCYYEHQVFIPNMGWAHDYNSDTTKMNCDAENYVWTYTNPEQTARKTVNCL
jgi:hypothetical protein